MQRPRPCRRSPGGRSLRRLAAAPCRYWLAAPGGSVTNVARDGNGHVCALGKIRALDRPVSLETELRETNSHGGWALQLHPLNIGRLRESRGDSPRRPSPHASHARLFASDPSLSPTPPRLTLSKRTLSGTRAPVRLRR